jgi:hypothetical protein
VGSLKAARRRRERAADYRPLRDVGGGFRR